MTTMTNMNTGHHNTSHGVPAGALTGRDGATERPRRAVYVITERATPEGSKSFWTKVGAAFENRDGSLTLKLDALPLSGTLQVRDDDKDRERRDRASHAPF
jgi:hypothetical protein